MFATQLDLSSPPVGKVKDIAEIRDLLKEKVASTPKGEWILGYGYDDTALADRRQLRGITRLVREVLVALREVWPERYPLWLRISATDWAEGGWEIEQSIELARSVRELGVDLVDVSSGGLVPGVQIPVGPGYQVGFAARIRREAGIATGAVGLITEPQQAQDIIINGQADVVLLAREELRDPYWPRRAAKALGVEIEAPLQYGRAW